MSEKFSYSRVEKYENCPYAYKLNYVDKNYVSANSLALSIGTLLHKVKEYIGDSLIKGRVIDYSLLENYIDRAGIDVELTELDSDKDSKEVIEGVELLKKKYFEDWITNKTKSGLSMKSKVEFFKEHLRDMENQFKQDEEWEVFKTEEPFEFIFEGVSFKGFIDRIDKNKKTGDFRVIDYKTKDAQFSDNDLKTPLQFVVYSMAISEKYGKEPIEFIYDLPLIGIQQKACSAGYLKRGQAKLIKLLTGIKNESFIPKPSPLCYWCPYCYNNTNAEAPFNKMCKYFSLWTPEDHNFNVNCKWGETLFTL